MLVLGLGGAALLFISGVSLAVILGVLLNFLVHEEKHDWICIKSSYLVNDNSERVNTGAK